VINPGIARTVALINSWGFATCDSGDGKTHDHPCDREGPYVVVKLPLCTRGDHAFAAANHLFTKLAIATGCRPMGTKSLPEGAQVQLMYVPHDFGSEPVLIDVSGICDEDLK
jgi:hypothetical protein